MFRAGHAAVPLPKPSDARDVGACRVEILGTRLGQVAKDELVRAAHAGCIEFGGEAKPFAFSFQRRPPQPP